MSVALLSIAPQQLEGMRIFAKKGTTESNNSSKNSNNANNQRVQHKQAGEKNFNELQNNVSIKNSNNVQQNSLNLNGNQTQNNNGLNLSPGEAPTALPRSYSQAASNILNNSLSFSTKKYTTKLSDGSTQIVTSDRSGNLKTTKIRDKNGTETLYNELGIPIQTKTAGTVIKTPESKRFLNKPTFPIKKSDQNTNPTPSSNTRSTSWRNSTNPFDPNSPLLNSNFISKKRSANATSSNPFIDAPTPPVVSRGNSAQVKKSTNPFAEQAGNPFIEAPRQPVVSKQNNGKVKNNETSSNPFAEQPGNPFIEASKQPVVSRQNSGNSDFSGSSWLNNSHEVTASWQRSSKNNSSSTNTTYSKNQETIYGD